MAYINPTKKERRKRTAKRRERSDLSWISATLEIEYATQYINNLYLHCRGRNWAKNSL